jgi:predicted PurR-regulated permease PerM
MEERDANTVEELAEHADKKPEFKHRGTLGGFLVRVGIIAAVVLILLLMWYAVDVLLLVFAGILFAVFLRGLSGTISGYTKLSEGWSLAIVIVFILLAFSGLVAWLAPSIVDQADELRRTLPQSIEKGEQWLSQFGLGRQIIERMPSLEEAFSDGSNTLSRITGVFSSTLSAITNFVIIIFIGIYLAVDGRTYTNGLVRLFPIDKRPRISEVVHELGFTLWWWLLGKSAAMLIVAILTWIGLIFLGVPLALTLGLIAGLFDFIPNIGPIIAGLPAVLIALTVSPATALYVLIFYIVVQTVESYVLTPILQNKTVHLPPALTIFAQVLLGVLVGGLGLILATPLAAVVFVLVRMLYLEDTLGESITKPSEEGKEDDDEKDPS